MPQIIPTVGDYVRFRHPVKGKTIGRVIKSTTVLSQRRVQVRYWYDAFSGWDYLDLLESSVELLEKPLGIEIPLTSFEEEDGR